MAKNSTTYMSIDEFKKLLEDKIAHTQLDYKPTQDKLSIPLIFRIYKKMKGGLLNFDAIKVAEGLIIDGHHRYIASVAACATIEKFASTINHNQIAFDWQDVKLSTIEYDSATDINYHNYNDAKRNGITIDEIEKMLSH